MYPILDTLPSLSHAHLPKFLITLESFLLRLHTRNYSLSFRHTSAIQARRRRWRAPSRGRRASPFHPRRTGPCRRRRAGRRGGGCAQGRARVQISLSEAKPAVVRCADGRVSTIVCGCLDGMGELRDDELGSWLCRYNVSLSLVRVYWLIYLL